MLPDPIQSAATPARADILRYGSSARTESQLS